MLGHAQQHYLIMLRISDRALSKTKTKKITFQLLIEIY